MLSIFKQIMYFKNTRKFIFPITINQSSFSNGADKRNEGAASWAKKAFNNTVSYNWFNGSIKSSRKKAIQKKQFNVKNQHEHQKIKSVDQYH